MYLFAFICGFHGRGHRSPQPSLPKMPRIHPLRGAVLRSKKTGMYPLPFGCPPIPAYAFSITKHKGASNFFPAGFSYLWIFEYFRA
jgi:hypothetical protein